MEPITAIRPEPPIQGPAPMPKQSLSQDDFLKLLVTQLTNQDPLNPTADTAFVAQMAQFTSLEQTRALKGEVQDLRQEQMIAQANGLIGREVEVNVDSETQAKGRVDSIQVEAGKPKIVIGDTAFGLDQLVSISRSP